MAVSNLSTQGPVLAWDKAQAQVIAPKKSGNQLTIVAVIVILLLALSGIWRFTHQSKPQQFVQVVSAGRDIPAGTRLGFMAVRYLEVPKAFATQTMVRSLNDVNDRVTRTFIPQGEPILETDLFPGHNGLSYSLENDERAITLQLEDDALVDHAIAPDDRVDILAISSKEGKHYTKTICQNARILMAAPKEQLLARRMGGATNNKVTLAVVPQWSEMITEAAESGKIRLVLRNRLSRSDQRLHGAAPEDLLPDSANADTDNNKAEEKKSAATDMSASAPATLPAPIMPPLPPVADAAAIAPMQWLVEMFSGGHKESCGVPER